jgi:protein-S-isoprenylcysteine O-methyltransferase Ste14
MGADGTEERWPLTVATEPTNGSGMTRPALALVLLGLCLALTFGVRTWRQLKHTGSSGFRGLSGRPGSAEWMGGVLFVAALVVGALAPVAEIRAWLSPLFEPARWLATLGVALVVLGSLATFWAQNAMGRSWRIGVDANEKTELIESGPFRWVRNPIFSFLLVTMAGLVLLVPNLLSVVAWLSLLIAIELQVRLVEEPYLLRTHGDRYARYAQRVGRFVPATGKLPASRLDF